MRKNSGEGLVLVVMIVLFISVSIWMLNRSESASDYYSPMSTMSPKPTGAMAFYELLEQENFAPQRFTQSEYDYPEDSCMILMPEDNDPLAMLFTNLDVRRLRMWMNDGNSLVLIADPVLPLTEDLIVELCEFVNPDIIYRNEVNASAKGAGQTGNVGALMRQFRHGQKFELPEDAPRFWDGVEEFESADPNPGSDTLSSVIWLDDEGFKFTEREWLAESGELIVEGDLESEDGFLPEFGEVLLSADNPAHPVVLHFRVGTGELIWLTRPEIAANSWINRADNHRLLLSMVAYAGREKTIFFDEHVHGYSSQHTGLGTLLFHTGGGNLLLVFVVAVILLFLGNAIRPARFHPQLVKPRRQSAEIILAQADLYRRAELRVAVADYLVDGLRRKLGPALRGGRQPNDREIAEILDNRMSGTTHSWQVLAQFLRQRIPPQSSKDLLLLAKSCHTAQVILARYIG